MAPSVLKKLTSLQVARETEIEGIRSRLAAKPRDSLNTSMVQSRLESVRDIWAEARTTHSEIVVREDAETDAYVADRWFQRIQTVYENASDEFLTLLSLFDRADIDSTMSDAGSDGRIGKLPPIPLPTFSGKYEDWASFCDLFTTLVHEAKPTLSDGTKLHYLKLCLKDGAAELIKDATTTNVNYANTWQALKARYDNPRLIINLLLTSFMEIPHLKKESAAELRSFIDEAQRIYRALASLKLPVDKWDVWLVFLLADRLDPESRKMWEAELSTKDSAFETAEETPRENPRVNAVEQGRSRPLPKYLDLVRFLEKRAQALSMVSADRRAEKRPSSSSLSGPQARKVHHASTSRSSGNSKCPLCSGTHILAKCFQLKEKNPHERFVTTKRLNACFNCLGAHRAQNCKSSGRCSVCQGKHHSLLHLKFQGNSRATPGNSEGSKAGDSSSDSKPPVASHHAASTARLTRKVILATARVRVIGPKGDSTYVRALLDQGSEVSFASESVVQLLELKRERISVPLSGVGASAAGTARWSTKLVIKSNADKKFELKTEALVLPKLTSQLPVETISNIDVKQFAGLALADPEFFVSDKVDLILGADVYGQLLKSGLKRFPSLQLVAQNTVFGWIVSGALQVEVSRRAEQSASQTPLQVMHCASMHDLDETLQRFWILEDLPTPSSKLQPDDEACERLFRENYTRDTQGRYEVHLPLKPSLPTVANETRQMAVGSLASMNRRFARDPKLAQAYTEFMEEYERLGHMTRIADSEAPRDTAWYLPHHAVVQESTSRWKLRVVFDASRRTREGHFLNNFLFTGAPLQSDLSLILLNWRRYLYAFTADIVKMFRQIRVNKADQDFQRIVWSPSIHSPPVDYRLTTVTYGTVCAPFLAIRTLSQLVEDEGAKFPFGAQCIKFETYVDDTFAGADELSTAVRKRQELEGILESAGISLDKWAANHPKLLPPKVLQGPAKEIDSDQSVKTLGVQWSPVQDQFKFGAAGIAELSAASTKRSVLSNIARLFDPLGWLSPITVIAKILMQDIWIQKCEWDSPLPAELRERWYIYCKSLSELSCLSIDRWLGTATGHSYQIHGFADASSRAYAAVVYLRVRKEDESFSVSLLAAKTKAAPIKTVSIPNLELCGAALLVKLVTFNS